MKVKNLKIKNLKSFINAEINLAGESAVLFGINGAGKSSLLRCINLLCADVINRVVNRDELRFDYDMELDDIRVGKQDAVVCGVFERDGKEVKYEKSITLKDGRVTNKGDLKNITDRIQSAYISSERQDNIPVFVCYNTNRQVLDIPLDTEEESTVDIYAAYRNAVDGRSDFADFFKWFRDQEDEENSIKVQRGDLSYEDRSLKAIRNAVLSMLPGFTNIHVARKPRLSMMVKKDGEEFDIANLSDGEKCLIALTGDIARRLSIANPERENPLEGEGVVLIDEIELHMHPSWQRRILKTLRTIFPGIQFVITTHSPQVLGEVDEGFKLYALEKDEDSSTVIREMTRLDGYDSNYILEEFMDTRSRSDYVESLVRRIYEEIDEGRYSEAEEKIGKLRKMTSENHEDVIAATMLLKRRMHAG